MTTHDTPIATFGAPPVHPFLAMAPATCFVGALITDIAYWCTAQMIWADFSAWMISAGILLTFLFAIVGVVEVLARRRVRARPRIWPYALGQLVVLVLATLNMLIHSRDAWTSVVPWGIALSAATVVAVLLTAWLGAFIVYRPRLDGVP